MKTNFSDRIEFLHKFLCPPIVLFEPYHEPVFFVYTDIIVAFLLSVVELTVFEAVCKCFVTKLRGQAYIMNLAIFEHVGCEIDPERRPSVCESPIVGQGLVWLLFVDIAFLFDVDSYLVTANSWAYESHHCSTCSHLCDVIFTV